MLFSFSGQAAPVNQPLGLTVYCWDIPPIDGPGMMS